MSEEPQTKGQVKTKAEDILKFCPFCGVSFTTPLSSAKDVSCADVEDGGCASSFKVFTR